VAVDVGRDRADPFIDENLDLRFGIRLRAARKQKWSRRGGSSLEKPTSSKRLHATPLSSILAPYALTATSWNASAYSSGEKSLTIRLNEFHSTV
jgi:hypothetical protein